MRKAFLGISHAAIAFGRVEVDSNRAGIAGVQFGRDSGDELIYADNDTIYGVRPRWRNNRLIVATCQPHHQSYDTDTYRIFLE